MIEKQRGGSGRDVRDRAILLSVDCMASIINTHTGWYMSFPKLQYNEKARDTG